MQLSVGRFYMAATFLLYGNLAFFGGGSVTTGQGVPCAFAFIFKYFIPVLVHEIMA